MPTELEHDPTGIFGEFLSTGRIDDFAHDGMDLEYLTEPAFVEKFAEQDHCGVVPIHIAHLYEQVFLLR